MAFLDEQNEAGASGLRSLKDPGSPQWCWQDYQLSSNSLAESRFGL